MLRATRNENVEQARSLVKVDEKRQLPERRQRCLDI
jgi:hypothetical protein